MKKKQTSISMPIEIRQLLKDFHAEYIKQTGVVCNFTELVGYVTIAGIEALKKEA